jgi:hypothetical protein
VASQLQTPTRTQLNEELPDQDSPDEANPDMLIMGNDTALVEETFGLGSNKKTLLVTRGVSLKNIVKASK